MVTTTQETFLQDFEIDVPSVLHSIVLSTKQVQLCTENVNIHYFLLIYIILLTSDKCFSGSMIYLSNLKIELT